MRHYPLTYMLRFVENFDLEGNCFENKKNWNFFWKIFQNIENFENPR